MLFSRFLRQKQTTVGPTHGAESHDKANKADPTLPPILPKIPYDRSSYAMSLHAKNSAETDRLISSKSDESSWPKTLESYIALYQSGRIDFEFPPPFPSPLNPDFATETGQLRSPRRASERARQTSVDSSLEIFSRPRSASHPPRKLSTIESDDEGELLSEKLSENETEKFAELEGITHEAGQTFGLDASLSLMSYESQIFIAGREGCLDRDNTVCSHAVLKGTFTDEAFVCLDLSKDIRFEKNNFPSLRFYASAPIYAPPAFGDIATHRKGQPIGVLCLLSTEARAQFTAAERHRLRLLADQATDALAALKVTKLYENAVFLEKERVCWKSQVKAALERGGLGSGLGVKELVASRHAVDKDYFVGRKEPVVPRRRLNSREECLATHCSTELPEKTRHLLELSLQLLTESLESFSFSYIVALPVVQTPANEVIPEFTTTAPSIPIRLLAAHNLPDPPPAFNIKTHTQVLLGRPLLFHSTKPPREDDLADGLVVPIPSLSGNPNGLLLGIFQTFGSQGERRSLSGTDHLFVARCVHDIRKIMADVKL